MNKKNLSLDMVTDKLTSNVFIVISIMKMFAGKSPTGFGGSFCSTPEFLFVFG